MQVEIDLWKPYARSLDYSFIIRTSPMCVIVHIIYIPYPHSSLVGILVSGSTIVSYHVL
jgi:hypothetical protein